MERNFLQWDALDLAIDPNGDIAAAICLDILDGWYAGLVWC